MKTTEDLSNMPIITLINNLYVSERERNQAEVNKYAYELAKRTWSPNSEKSFENILYELGYYEEEVKIKTR